MYVGWGSATSCQGQVHIPQFIHTIVHNELCSQKRHPNLKINTENKNPENKLRKLLISTHLLFKEFIHT